MDRPSRQKINKKTVAINNTLGPLDLIDIYSIHILFKYLWNIL